MRKRRLNKKGYILVGIIGCYLTSMLIGMVMKVPQVQEWLRDAIWNQQMSMISFASTTGSQGHEWDPFLLNQYVSQYMVAERAVEDLYTYEQILLEEARGENMVTEQGDVIIHNEPYVEEEEESIVDNSNHGNHTQEDWVSGEFTLATAPSKKYNMSDYEQLDELIKEFYVVDSQTAVDAKLLNVDSLASKDMTLQVSNEQPQILIYHTHSQEAFIDSIPGDSSTTVVGAGDELARILSEEYGYNVIHHRGEYDLPTRDEAYSRAEPALEAILEEYPSIEVVIDDCVIIGLT